jgi:hypothetical protein
LHSHPLPSCGPGADPAYLNSLSFVAMGRACGRQLALSIHSVSRCSQPWRRAESCSAVRGSPSLSSLARSTAIHPASSGSQGWRAGALSSIGRFELGCVSCVTGWVSNEVAGLQRRVGAYFALSTAQGSPSIHLHPPNLTALTGRSRFVGPPLGLGCFAAVSIVTSDSESK